MAGMRTLAPVDAQLLWLSTTMPNDQFLLFAFGDRCRDGASCDTGGALAEMRDRAERCAELRLRIVDDRRWRYPRWQRGEITDEQFTVRDAADWQECLDRVSRLAQLDVTRMSWRVHVFPDVRAVPRAGSGSVVVVQIAHALGDGTRSAQLAAALLGRGQPVREMAAPQRGLLPWRAVLAARAHQRLQRDIDAGLLGPPVAPRPALSLNEGPRRDAVVRTLAVGRDRLPGPTVTVGALVAIADALGGYLAARGEDISRLGAEVPMAGAEKMMMAHNNFRNVSVDLHPRLGRSERAQRIAAQLTAHRRRGEHPAMRAAAAAFAAVPAPLLRWGVGRFDPNARSGTVTGHTVVSSVNRGPADLCFGGRPVVLTAGYPALSPMMSLTHGVHGIGDTVAVSVQADPGTVDVDDYIGRLSHALG